MARCPKCASFTYDVVGLSDEEVRRLVLETEGRVLNRLVMRTDGHGMSVDCGHDTVCPPSPRPWRAGAALVVVALVAAAAAGVGVVSARWMSPPGTGLERLPGPEYDAVLLEGQGAREAERNAADLGPNADGADAQAPENEADPGRHLASERVPLPDFDERGDPVTGEGAFVVDVHLADVTTSWSTQELRPGQMVETLETQLEPVRRCYGQALNVNRSYRGTLTTHLSVGKDGSVSRVYVPPRTNRVANARLQQCVEGALKGLRFGRRSTGTVSFRLVFAGVH